MTYPEKLQQPEWRALRARIFTDRNHECEDCGITYDADYLNLHHKYYESKREPWDYQDDVFKVLCLDCHALTTEAIKSLLYTIGRLTGNQVVDLSNAMANAFADTGDPLAISNWLQLCLSDVRQIQVVLP